VRENYNQILEAMASKRTHLSNGKGEPFCGIRSKNPILFGEADKVTCKSCLSASTSHPFQGGFFSKIAGVSQENADGRSRQAIVERCHLGERLILKLEPGNGNDEIAVKVLRENGEHLGYLRERPTAELHGFLLRGQIIPCV
jgi:hypothetical protein